MGPGLRRGRQRRAGQQVLPIRHDGPNCQFRFQEFVKSEYSTCLVGQISGTTPPSPRHHEGTLARSSRNVGAGCDGRCGVRCLHRTKTLTAYGEVVWSWRRDPGVKLARSIAPATVARKAAHRGEHEGSRKTIARGKPGCLGCTCLIRVLSFTTSAHGAAGAVGARLSLRPLRVQRDNEIAKPGRKPAAGMRTYVSPSSSLRSSQRPSLHSSCPGLARASTTYFVARQRRGWPGQARP
jgi:hypothetical protein